MENNENNVNNTTENQTPVETPVETLVETPVETQEQTMLNDQPIDSTINNVSSNSGSNSKLIKGLIIGIVAFVAVVGIAVGILVFVLTRPIKIDLKKYVEVKCEGVNEYGYVDVDIDEDLEDDIKKALKDKNHYSKRNLRKVEKAISNYKVKNDGELSNGDTVNVVFKINNDVFKEMGIKFENTTISKKVSGLKKVKKIDAFEDMDVSFYGSSPNGSISVYGAPDGLYYECDPEDGLSNGDEVTVTVRSWSDDEGEFDYYAKEYGYVPKEETTTVTVEGLKDYIMDLDKDKDAVEDLKSEAEKSVKEAYYGWDVEYESSEYQGVYLATQKDSDTYTWYTDRIAYIYKVNLKDDSDANKKYSIYIYLAEDDVLVNEDGKLDEDNYIYFDTTSDEVVLGKNSSGSDIEAYGYKSLDEAKSAVEKLFDDDDMEITNSFK